MRPRDTIRRMAEANPVPDPEQLHPNVERADRLFSSIERRREHMIGTTPQRLDPVPAPRKPWYLRPRLILAVFAIAAVALIAPVAALLRAGPEAPTESSPASLTSTSTPTTAATPTTTSSVTTSTSALEPGSYVWEQAAFVDGQVTETSEVHGVAHTGSVFVAVGSVFEGCGHAWVSTDGATWNGAPAAGGSVAPPCRLHLVDVASNGEISVAVGTHGTMDVDGYEAEATVMVSEDGYNWSHPTGGDWTPFGMGEEVTSVAGSEAGFVAAGSGIWFSASPLDGQPWMAADAPAVVEIADVTAGPEGFFAVGSVPGSVAIFGQQWDAANAVLHSSDGQTWSIVAELTGSFQAGSECWVAGNAIAYGPHGYVIGGDCQSENAQVAYSSIWVSDDGFIWNQVDFDAAAFGDPAHITTIAAHDNGYLAGGWGFDMSETHATMWISPDGNTWVRTELSSDGSSGIFTVFQHEETAIAVGHERFGPAIWTGAAP